MEELLARHRKEQRDLQNRITSKKKNATKKTRKGVNDECESLERELKDRQRDEIAALKPGEIVEDALESLSLGEDDGQTAVNDLTETNERTTNGTSQAKKVQFEANIAEAESIEDKSIHIKKPNRQKARLARRAQEQEAAAIAAEQEAANLPDLREQEMEAMEKLRERHGLVETFVQPDGHCLYSACALGIDPDQVSAAGPFSTPYQNVRLATAKFIADRPNDFAAFLEEPLDTYVKKIQDTAEWGGQLELQAIARAFNVNVRVLQADGRIEEFHAEDATAQHTPDVWLAYYRHSFGLGEHYNALRKAHKT
jgi:OTU domain-containing protein 6